MQAICSAGALSLLLLACGGGGSEKSSPPQAVQFSVATDPIGTEGYLGPDTDFVLEAQGDLILYGARGEYLSLDGGRSWLSNIDPSYQDARVIDATTILSPSAFGFTQYDATSNAWSNVAPPPPGPVRTSAWTRRDSDGALFIAHETIDNIYRYASGAWTTLDLGSSVPNDLTEVYAIEVDGDTIYAATQAGLYTSSDDGQTWSLSFENIYMSDLVLLPSGSLLVDTPVFGVQRIAPGAQDFSEVTLPEDAFPRLEDDGALYLTQHSSTDEGMTWTPLFDYGELGGAITSGGVARYLNDRAYFHFPNVGLFRSSNPPNKLQFVGGVATALASQGLPGALRANVVAAGEGGRLIATTAPLGGLVYLAVYEPQEAEWFWLPGPDTALSLGRAQLQRLSTGRIFAMQESRAWFSDDDGASWSDEIAVWPEPPIGSLFEAVYVDGVFETSDGSLYASSRWQYCPNNIGECTIYSVLAKSADGGQSWSSQNQDAVAVQAAAGQTLYGNGQASSDGGLTWTQSDVPIPLLGFPDGALLFTDDMNPPFDITLRAADGSEQSLGPMTLTDADISTVSSIGVARSLSLDADGSLIFLCGQPLSQVCRANAALRP